MKILHRSLAIKLKKGKIYCAEVYYTFLTPTKVLGEVTGEWFYDAAYNTNIKLLLQKFKPLRKKQALVSLLSLTDKPVYIASDKMVPGYSFETQVL